MVTIYILECEKGKYYVGKSSNVELRIDEHFANNGPEWTKKI
jgi:predicted GIY-YIG superfamily endonuclease